MKRVISAFPGVGKSTIFKEATERGLKPAHVFFNDYTKEYEIQVPSGDGVPVFDSDSSKFDKEQFPGNYVKHIKETLDKLDDVVILVSSHKDVREMLRSQGIEYTLAYPQRELKDEYIRRYKARDNTEGFIGMMDNAWNDFIDSCEEDPTPEKIVLGEGEFLGEHYLKPEIQSVSGVENMNDDPNWEEKEIEQRLRNIIKPSAACQELLVPVVATPAETTAVIVDVNAGPEVTDQQSLPTDNPEPSILNTPEGTAQSTLTAEVVEGGVVTVDTPSVAETPDLGVTTAEERDPMVDPDFVEAMVSEGPGRTELIEAKYDMQNDIEALESVITTYNDAGPEAAGMEQFADGSELLTAAVGDIKKRYDVDVEPTIAGLEGFFGTLKETLGKVTDALKGKPSKSEAAKIKKYFYESRKAVDEYSSPAWLNAQKFINVGNAKLQVPAVFKEVNTAAGMSPIVEQFSKVVLKLNDEHLRNNKARRSSGIKIFNALKNKPGTTNNAEIDKLVNSAGTVKPDALDDVKLNDVKSLINVSLSPGELPVLKKDDIPGVIKILQDGLGVINKLVNANEDYRMDLLTYDDILESDFWFDAKTPTAMKVIEAIEFDHNYHNLDMIEEGYVQQMLVIAKFIEMWILHSVK